MDNNIINSVPLNNKLKDISKSGKDMPISIQVPKLFFSVKDMSERVQGTSKELNSLDIPIKILELPTEPLFNLESMSSEDMGHKFYASMISIAVLLAGNNNLPNLDYYSKMDGSNQPSKIGLGNRTTRPILICNADVHDRARSMYDSIIGSEDLDNLLNEIIINVNSEYDQLGATVKLIERIRSGHNQSQVKVCLSIESIEQIENLINRQDVINHIGSFRIDGINKQEEIRKAVKVIRDKDRDIPILVKCDTYQEYKTLIDGVSSNEDKSMSSMFSWGY